MDPLTIALVIVGIVLACSGGIVLLVAAFRVNVWWGLASLFLPLASLIFVICHWSRAKVGFALSMLGSLVLVGVFFQATPQLREALASAAILPESLLPGEAPVKDLTAQIQEKRDLLEKLEPQFVTNGPALAKRFAALTARRKALKDDDASGVAEFNAEAAAYQAQNESRKAAKNEIDVLRKDLEKLLDERARTGAGRTVAAPPDSTPEIPARPPSLKPAGTAKRVVMFTTATCPACVRAKSYLAQKGVPFEERDVNRSSDAMAEFRRLGGSGVPLILVGDERVRGFNAQALDKLL